MKHFLAIAFSVLTCCGYGQQFMINRVKDTVEYNSAFTIDKETGDTSFVNDCEHFEKVNGEIINRIDKDGVKQGNWVICDSVTGCEKGRFKNGKRKGIWQKMDKDGTLLKEWEEVTFNKIPIVVKEIDYSSGKGIIVIDKPFLSLRTFINCLNVTILRYSLCSLSWCYSGQPSWGNNHRRIYRDPFIYVRSRCKS